MIFKSLKVLGEFTRYNYTGVNIQTELNEFKKICDYHLAPKNKTYDLLSNLDVVTYFLNWILNQQNSGVVHNKGILLKGNTGTGKTFIFNMIQEYVTYKKIKVKINNWNEHFKCSEYPILKPNIFSAKDIANEFSNDQTGGEKSLLKYYNMNFLMLDDIGQEPLYSSHFNLRLNVIEEIIRKRYELQKVTFATTNIVKLTDIDGKGTPLYDQRIISRMKEMFHVLPIKHNIDYREL